MVYSIYPIFNKYKILIYKENNVIIDLDYIGRYINKNSKKFEITIGKEEFILPEKVISASTSYRFINEKILSECKNYDSCLFLTIKPYDNNYFIDFPDDDDFENIRIISYSNWNYYTNLSLNNGVVYFVLSDFADSIDDSEDSCSHLGCIFNFLANKQEIDVGMRNAHIHPSCEKERIIPFLKKHNIKKYEELQLFLTDLASASKQDFDIVTYWNLKENEVVSCHIDKIVIQNFFSIKQEIILKELSNKAIIFLLGENGSGKSIFLKALLIALKKFQIQTFASKEITGIIDDMLAKNRNFELSATTDSNVIFNNSNNLYLKNLGYIQYTNLYT